jgi:hypothetical protein
MCVCVCVLLACLDLLHSQSPRALLCKGTIHGTFLAATLSLLHAATLSLLHSLHEVSLYYTLHYYTLYTLNYTWSLIAPHQAIYLDAHAV